MVLDDVIVTMATVVDKTIPLMTGVDQPTAQYQSHNGYIYQAICYEC